MSISKTKQKCEVLTFQAACCKQHNGRQAVVRLIDNGTAASVDWPPGPWSQLNSQEGSQLRDRPDHCGVLNQRRVLGRDQTSRPIKDTGRVSDAAPPKIVSHLCTCPRKILRAFSGTLCVALASL